MARRFTSSPRCSRTSACDLISGDGTGTRRDRNGPQQPHPTQTRQRSALAIRARIGPAGRPDRLTSQPALWIYGDRKPAPGPAAGSRGSRRIIRRRRSCRRRRGGASWQRQERARGIMPATQTDCGSRFFRFQHAWGPGPPWGRRGGGAPPLPRSLPCPPPPPPWARPTMRWGWRGGGGSAPPTCLLPISPPPLSP
jgi:hypothetical protein